jgi:TonB family protein
METSVMISTRTAAGFVLLALLAVAPAGRAQDEGAGAAPVLEPPELIEYVRAEYPAEALAEGLEAQVVARIHIDAAGLVTDVEIVEAAGRGFDEAARAAMLRFVFAPATRDGEPIAAQVLYRYTFFLDEAEVEADAPPPPARLSGRVTDVDGEPVPQAALLLVREGGEAGGEELPPVATGEDGAFDVPGLSAGRYRVEVVAAGYKALAAEEELEEGEDRELIYRLEPEGAVFETVVRDRRPPREVIRREITRREITRREITRIPGTGGDALRSIQNLPGMARAPGISGALIVRGSAPGDSRVFFDQLPVPLLYHFGGLTSVINSDLLERIDFYPGNYSVRYGGATGGIVDVYPRAPATDRFHASLDADFWDISALVETPIGEDWSVAVSARRSYIDWILKAVLPEDGGFELTVAPRYYDYQVVADWHPDASDNLRLFLFGSDDKLVFVLGDDVADNPNFGGGIDFRTLFHQLQIRWDHRFGAGVENQLNLGTGYQLAETNIGEDFRFDLANCPLYLRNELSWITGRFFTLRTGIDAELTHSRYTMRVPDMLPGEGEQLDPLTANDAVLEIEGARWYYRPAWYAELELTAVERLRVLYGLRLDYFGSVAEVGVDPRLTARYEVVDGTTLKGGVGLFHQEPFPAQSDDTFGNPDLGLIGAVHYGLGVEQKLPAPLDAVEVGLEGFYKDVFDLVVSSDEVVERGGEPVPERYDNDGTGKIYGLELMIKHQPTERLFGWIAYTLMKSARIDRPGEDERPFDYDQTHILTVVASAVLGRGWEAGVRFRLVTGNPETPVVATAYDADSDIYWPIYGETNSARLPMFHQLDLRIDKNWNLKAIKLAIYLDVQNVYNQKNVEGYSYSYDYSQRVYFTGLPILPSLGLKLEY